MNLTDDVTQDLLLTAARAPNRTLPEHHLLQQMALRLLEARESRWIEAALEARVCPACLWPPERCPDCDPDPETPVKFQEVYCPFCDIHWEAAIDVADA